MGLLRQSFLFLSALLVYGAAQAADIRPAKSARGEPLAAIMIEGEIKPGDYLKFVNTFLDNRGRNYGVILYSPGGDFTEALKIGRLIHALKLTTRAPDKIRFEPYEIKNASNKLCASSCFFMFVAGAQRFGEIVGIHRPYLSKSAYQQLSMDDAGKTHAVVRQMVETYLKELDVPLSYVDRIMAIDSGDVEWLTEEELKKNFNDYAPAYREWIEAKCSPNSNSDTQRMLGILDATPVQYKNTPVDDIPYEPKDKAFLNKYFAQEDHYYSCRNSIQRTEVDRALDRMLSRKIKREAELREKRPQL